MRKEQDTHTNHHKWSYWLQALLIPSSHPCPSPCPSPSSAALQSFSSFWIGDMQFTLELLNQFLEDMHEYSTVSVGGVVMPVGWAMGERQVDQWVWHWWGCREGWVMKTDNHRTSCVLLHVCAMPTSFGLECIHTYSMCVL